MIDKVVPLVRIINALIVEARHGPRQWPLENVTYRGIGLPEAERCFFTKDKIYRVPMFLATSFKRGTAELFMKRMSKGGNKPTLFIFKFDPVKRCMHANYLGDVTAVSGEEEFLLPPYAGFK